MKKIMKKVAMVVAFVMCISLSLPAMAQVGVYAGTVSNILTVTTNYQIAGFNEKGVIGTPYVVKAPNNITELTKVTVTKPNGVVSADLLNDDDSIDNYTGVTVAGTYTVSYYFGTYVANMTFTVANPTEATIVLAEPTEFAKIIPSIVNPGKGTATAKEFTLPTATVLDENGKVIPSATPNITVSASLGDGTALVQGTDYTYNASDRKLTLDVAGADATTYKATYTAIYKYTVGNYIATKTIVIVADLSHEDKPYTVSFIGNTDITAELGVETKLPTISAKDEDGNVVDVFYKVKAELAGQTAVELNKNEENIAIFKPTKAGTYTITYEIKNINGTAPTNTSTSFTVSNVKDTTRPEIVVTTPYTYDAVTGLTNPTYIEESKLVDATSALVNTSKDTDILILPAYAKDSANQYVDNNITLNRIIKKVSTSDIVFNEKDDVSGNNTNKVLVFNMSDDNKTTYDNAEATATIYSIKVNGKVVNITKEQIQVVDNETFEFDAGTNYTVKYTAKDKATTEVEKVYNLNIVGSIDEGNAADITINFDKDLIPTYFNSSDKTFTFNAPSASFKHSDSSLNIIDDYVSTYITYQTSTNKGETWGGEIYTYEDDSWIKYDKELGKYVFTYDNTDTTGINAIRIIAVGEANFNSGFIRNNVQKSFIILGAGSDSAQTTIDSIEDTSLLTNNYKQNTHIELPTVIYNDTDKLYDLLNVEIFVKNDVSGNLFEVKNMARRVSSDKLIIQNASFYASESGVYKVTYISTDSDGNKTIQFFDILIVEDPTTWAPHFTGLPTVSSLIPNGTIEFGEGFALPSGIDVELTTTELKVNPDTKGNETQNYLIKSNKAYRIEGNKFIPTTIGDYELTFYTEILNNTTDEEFTILEKVYSFSVKDTVGPAFNASTIENDFAELNPNGTTINISTNANVNLPIPQGDFDSKTSYVTITSSKTADKKLFLDKTSLGTNFVDDETFKIEVKNNTIYKVVYTLIDENGTKTTSKEFSFGVGDIVAPKITIEDSIVNSNYKVGDDLSIGSVLSKITITDDVSGVATENNKIMYLDDGKYKLADDCTLKIVLKNTTTGSTYENKLTSCTNDNLGYLFEDLQAGTYNLVVTATDGSGQSSTNEKIMFTVAEDANYGMTSEEVLGVVLIIISVLVLGGVITYFVVTRKSYTKKIR